MLDVLVCGIRAAGLDVSPQELQDILWLAERLPAGEPASGIGGTTPSQPGKPKPRQARTDEGVAEPFDDDVSSIDRDAASWAGEGTASTALYARRLTGTVSASTLRVPGVASGGPPDDLRRALQPFARRVPSRWRKTLDEEATAAYAVEVGLWCPVYKPVRERWFDLCLVVEDSPSITLWSDTLAELVRLLRNQAGFRRVTIYRWSDGKGEEVSTLDGRRRLAVSRLVERDRRLLVLLVTDGTSARWCSGAAQELLCGMGSHASVSVLQMLPQRAWRHSIIGEPELKLYGERAGEANTDMKALLPWWVDESEFRQGFAVPVIGLDAATLKPWARTMTAQGGASVPAVLFTHGQAEAAARQDATGSAGAAEKVARYRGMVSREAYDLAVFLSVPDPLTVPVMRLVQRTMLPSTGTAELAEFFVGGLLERMRVDGDVGEAAYRLAPGVREELMKSLRYSEEGHINEQLRSVGRLLENTAGGGRSFDAYFPTPAGLHRLSEWTLPFASLSKAVLTGGAFKEPADAQSKREAQAMSFESPPLPGPISQAALRGLEVTSRAKRSPLYRVLKRGRLPNGAWRAPRFEKLDYPLLYAATSIRAALSEMLLTLAGSSHPMVVDEVALRQYECATLRPTRVLSLVSLSRPQLRRLGIDSTEFELNAEFRGAIIDAIRGEHPYIDGVQLMSRADAATNIVCLFGDRVRQDELDVTTLEPLRSLGEKLGGALSLLGISLVGGEARKRILISSPGGYARYASLLGTALEQDLTVERPTEVSAAPDPASALRASIERADAIVAIMGPGSRGQSEVEIRLARSLGKRVISVQVSADIKEAGESRDMAVANIDASGRVAALSGLQGADLSRVINSTVLNILSSLGVDTSPLLLELRHTYEDAASRFFNPPDEVQRVGRRLREGDFRTLVSQLRSDELLIGLYENQALAPVATHVSSRSRLRDLSQPKLTPLGFYAMRRERANRGWDRETPVPARESDSDPAPLATADRGQTAKGAAAETLDRPSRPASGGTTLEFDKSTALTPQLREHLQAAFAGFEAYLVRCGYRPRPSILKVFVDPGLKDNVYYEPGRVVLGAPLAMDTDAFFRECGHHALLSVPYRALGKLQGAVESGLADYFACSFNDDPRFGRRSVHLFRGDPRMASKGAIRVLENDRRFDEVRKYWETHDVGEIWGGAFWEMRQELGAQVADGFLFDGWHTSVAQHKRDRAKDFKRTFITTLMKLAAQGDPRGANDVAAIFARRGFGRFRPSAD